MKNFVIIFGRLPCKNVIHLAKRHYTKIITHRFIGFFPRVFNYVGMISRVLGEKISIKNQDCENSGTELEINFLRIDNLSKKDLDNLWDRLFSEYIGLCLVTKLMKLSLALRDPKSRKPDRQKQKLINLTRAITRL